MIITGITKICHNRRNDSFGRSNRKTRFTVAAAMARIYWYGNRNISRASLD